MLQHLYDLLPVVQVFLHLYCSINDIVLVYVILDVYAVFVSCSETGFDKQKCDRHVGADISQARCSSYRCSVADAKVFIIWCKWRLCLSNGSQRWTCWLALWQQGESSRRCIVASVLYSPCLWNQLPLSLRQPHSGTSSSISYLPVFSPITSSLSDSPLCTSITPSVFHSRLKTYLFRKSYPL